MASESKERLLSAMTSTLKPPPPLVQPGVEQMDAPITIPNDTVFPPTQFTKFRYDAQKRRMPQCIAHRGYKAKFPENTMTAFKAAVDCGVQALETDVHVTKDEVVVLSHDPTLKRCYGINKKIKDVTWAEIQELRTIAEPHQPMPKLKELLDYLAQPGLEEIWLLLDIKLSNDAETIMRLLSSTIASVQPPKSKAWQERVLLGIWAAKYLPFAADYLPGFPVTHIGFSIPYARHFLTIPNISFNMLLPMLIAPGGRKFIRDAREKHGRPVYAWTVNERDKMEWCIRRKLDGVITDDPAKFLQVCEEFDEAAKKPWVELRVRGYMDMVRIYFFVTFMAFFFRKMLRPVASPALIRREGQLKN